MSDPTHRPPTTVEERPRLGAGFGVADQDHVVELLSALGRHLARWRPEDVDLEVSVKNRDGPEQKGDPRGLDTRMAVARGHLDRPRP